MTLTVWGPCPVCNNWQLDAPAETSAAEIEAAIRDHDAEEHPGQLRGKYDYAAGLRLVDEGKPGADGCMGCFRCRAGDHGSCHGCSCPCAWSQPHEVCAWPRGYDADSL